jgi:hypothetical protein
MPSTFSWLDHSDNDRRRVFDALDKFKDTDTRDELGLGALRDGFANLFFPGTSVVQTRARYFLFVPWIYRRVEAKAAADRLTAGVRKEEVRVRDALMKSEDHDRVIGKLTGAATKRLPSSVYWLGLFRWRIRLFAGSQDDYHRSFEHRQRRAREVLRDDDGDRVDTSGSQAWHPYLPPPPSDFPDVASFTLLADEARYLQERIALSAPASLLAFLVRQGRTLEGDSPWAHPQFAEFPLPVREALEHARLLAETTQGASLLYNLMLSEELAAGDLRDERVEHYRSRLVRWCEELRHRAGALQHWDRAAFWRLGQEIANVSPATRRFVDTWVDFHSWRGLSGAADSQAARAVIRDRELRLKGRGRARLGNPRALELWGGEAGTARLSYRWGPAVRILSDIHAAVRVPHA